MAQKISDINWDWVESHLGEDPIKLRLKKDAAEHLLDIVQVECRKKAGKKLSSTLEQNPRFIFGNTLASEQSTSDMLAQYHASLIPRDAKVCDLTSGLGIDVLHLAQRASSVTAIELQPDLCEALEINAQVDPFACGKVKVICGDCRDVLRDLCYVSDKDNKLDKKLFELSEKNSKPFDVVFIDPARRSSTGKRLFSLHDCQPDVVEMIPLIRKACNTLIIKMSPMLDITQVCRELPCVSQIIVLGTNRECKELIAVCRGDKPEEKEVEVSVVTLANAEFNYIDKEGVVSVEKGIVVGIDKEIVEDVDIYKEIAEGDNIDNEGEVGIFKGIAEGDNPTEEEVEGPFVRQVNRVSSYINNEGEVSIDKGIAECINTNKEIAEDVDIDNGKAEGYKPTEEEVEGSIVRPVNRDLSYINNEGAVSIEKGIAEGANTNKEIAVSVNIDKWIVEGVDVNNEIAEGLNIDKEISEGFSEENQHDQKGVFVSVQRKSSGKEGISDLSDGNLQKNVSTEYLHSGNSVIKASKFSFYPSEEASVSGVKYVDTQTIERRMRILDEGLVGYETDKKSKGLSDAKENKKGMSAAHSFENFGLKVGNKLGEDDLIDEDCSDADLRGENLHFSSETLYLYEPSPSMMKAGAYQLLAERFSLMKVGANSHLYLSEFLKEDFPGTIWKVRKIYPLNSSTIKALAKQNLKGEVAVRNYPMAAEALRKKLKIGNGVGYRYMATTIGDGMGYLFEVDLL